MVNADIEQMKEQLKQKGLLGKTFRLHLEKVPRVVGFPIQNAEPGEIIPIMVTASLTSEHPDFSMFAEQLWDTFASRVPIFSPMVCNYFATFHADESADLYLNAPFTGEMMSKRDMGAGQVVKRSDIADVRRLVFPDVEISETDNVVCCFKVTWDFGLYFDFSIVDLSRDRRVVDDVWLRLGALYRSLLFAEAYRAIQSEEQSQALLADGWFPFIEILGGEFEELSRIYKGGFHVEEQVNKVLDRFGKDRIAKISNKWWKNTLFETKKLMLRAGLESFLRGDAEGYVCCIKTLLTEANGIMTLSYFQDTGTGDARTPKLIEHIGGKGETRTGVRDSLFFPAYFRRYLTDVVFPRFDLQTGKIGLSRHTASHGVAKPEDYTRAHALQTILILDQIYFYHGHPTAPATGNASGAMPAENA